MIFIPSPCYFNIKQWRSVRVHDDAKVDEKDLSGILEGISFVKWDGEERLDTVSQ
jgi:hypothetical protein